MTQIDNVYAPESSSTDYSLVDDGADLLGRREQLVGMLAGYT